MSWMGGTFDPVASARSGWGVGVRRIVALPCRSAVRPDVRGDIGLYVRVVVRVVRVVGVLVVVFILVIVFVDEVRGVQKGTLLCPDVHERCLDAGQYSFDLPDVDIADHAPSFRPIDEELNELVVLQYGDPRLARVRVDQYFALHLTPQ
jgi:hypothetical protein